MLQVLLLQKGHSMVAELQINGKLSINQYFQLF